jgi:hypothetical protein
MGCPKKTTNIRQTRPLTFSRILQQETEIMHELTGKLSGLTAQDNLIKSFFCTRG